ncbi:MAG: CHC2 zinc finger domain-containing protein [Anaerolineae bacterium]|jgi:DNA primase
MRENITELKARVDLAALVEQNLGPAQKQRGRWWWWLCPFHTESRASFGVTPDSGRFKCFGCGESGDHIDYLEKRGGLSTGQAIAELHRIAGLPEMKRPPKPALTGSRVYDTPPSPTWQARARAFAAYAQEQLWTDAGTPGLDYLCSGGLAEATIRRFGLGWNPHVLWDEAQRWGLSGGKVYLARGVVIPCEVSGNLWYVKIRCFDPRGRPIVHPGAKYGGPRGGRGALFNADALQANGRPLLLCEGERDAMLAYQELSDMVDVATLGGAGRRSLGHWSLWLLPYRQILAAYDADLAGREGAMYLASLFERVQGIRVPHGEDLTGFHAGGGKLRAWLHSHLKQSGRFSPSRGCEGDLPSHHEI